MPGGCKVAQALGQAFVRPQGQLLQDGQNVVEEQSVLYFSFAACAGDTCSARLPIRSARICAQRHWIYYQDKAVLASK